MAQAAPPGTARWRTAERQRPGGAALHSGPQANCAPSSFRQRWKTDFKSQTKQTGQVRELSGRGDPGTLLDAGSLTAVKLQPLPHPDPGILWKPGSVGQDSGALSAPRGCGRKLNFLCREGVRLGPRPAQPGGISAPPLQVRSAFHPLASVHSSAGPISVAFPSSPLGRGALGSERAAGAEETGPGPTPEQGRKRLSCLPLSPQISQSFGLVLPSSFRREKRPTSGEAVTWLR